MRIEEQARALSLRTGITQSGAVWLATHAPNCKSARIAARVEAAKSAAMEFGARLCPEDPTLAALGALRAEEASARCRRMVGTARHPAFAGLGSGRRYAGDGPAWDVAIATASHDLALRCDAADDAPAFWLGAYAPGEEPDGPAGPNDGLICLVWEVFSRDGDFPPPVVGLLEAQAQVGLGILHPGAVRAAMGMD